MARCSGAHRDDETLGNRIIVGKRRKAREIVLQALYEMEFSDRDGGEILNDIFLVRASTQETMAYARRILEQTIIVLPELDKRIKEVLENWDINRLSLVDKNILRFSLAEILFITDVPGKVVVDEALEIANKFSSANAGKLINGVLDHFLKERDKQDQ